MTHYVSVENAKMNRRIAKRNQDTTDPKNQITKRPITKRQKERKGGKGENDSKSFQEHRQFKNLKGCDYKIKI